MSALLVFTATNVKLIRVQTECSGCANKAWIIPKQVNRTLEMPKESYRMRSSMIEIDLSRGRLLWVSS